MPQFPSLINSIGLSKKLQARQRSSFLMKLEHCLLHPSSDDEQAQQGWSGLRLPSTTSGWRDKNEPSLDYGEGMARRQWNSSQRRWSHGTTRRKKMIWTEVLRYPIPTSFPKKLKKVCLLRFILQFFILLLLMLLVSCHNHYVSSSSSFFRILVDLSLIFFGYIQVYSVLKRQLLQQKNWIQIWGKFGQLISENLVRIFSLTSG